MPPARLRVPGRAPTVPHSVGAVSGSATVLMRNIVVPYMSIRSPTRCGADADASDQASMVPAMTGVPAASPVSAAACGGHGADDVAGPAQGRQVKVRGHDRAPTARTSPARRRRTSACTGWPSGGRGSSRRSASSPATSWAGRTAGAGAATAGSCSASQASFGPTACVERAEPQRSRIAAAPPSASVNRGDLVAGPGVDPVQHGRPQRLAALVGHQHARAHAADADRAYVGGARPRAVR